MGEGRVILHLSDLHFGPHCRFAKQEPSALARRFVRAIEDTRSDFDFAERVSLIIVTGDITEAARPKEFAQASAFLAALTDALKIPRRHVVFVPGNHDVSWFATKRIILDQQEHGFEDDERDRRIQEHKLVNYQRFVKAFYEPDELTPHPHQLTDHCAYVHNFPELKIAVATLDSCERESHLPQGGHLGGAQAQALMDYWSGNETDDQIKIVAIHHNPIATDRSNIRSWVEHLRSRGGLDENMLDHFVADTMGFDGWERLRAATEGCRVPLILHGHHHVNADGTWTWRGRGKGHSQILSAGSWGLAPNMLPEGLDAMMHMLRIDLEQSEGRSVHRTYNPRARSEGEVEPGTFVADSAHQSGSPFDLTLPVGLGQPITALDHGSRMTQRHFLEAYESCFADQLSRWEPEGLPGGVGSSEMAEFEKMYLPLRIGMNNDQNKLDEGTVIEPDALLAGDRSLVLCGAVGSGKTSWMRYAFRRLIAQCVARNILPFLIELDELGKTWGKVSPKEQTIESYLVNNILIQLSEPVRPKSLDTLFEKPEGPRPVLLMDGWEALGDLGRKVRNQLVGLRGRYPSLLVIVTSRPDEKSRPSKVERFEELEIKSLSDSHIEEFVYRFYRYVRDQDEISALASSKRFLRALDDSEGALNLARVPRQLTQMLCEDSPTRVASELLRTNAQEHRSEQPPAVRSEGISKMTKLVREANEGQGVARDRIACGVNPTWPLEPEELVILRLWPGQRPRVSLRLQNLISLGGAEEMRALSARMLRAQEHDDDVVQKLAEHWALELADDLADEFARDLARDWARDWARQWVGELPGTGLPYWKSYWVRHWAQYWTKAAAQDLLSGMKSEWVRDLVPGLVERWARDWGLPNGQPWVIDLAALELGSFGRAGTRVMLAHSVDQSSPLLRFFQIACRLSLNPECPEANLRFDAALEALPATIDPLWPALARQITRRSSAEDRELLEDLARHPDKRPTPLSWGLRYYVRGDLVFDDGRELELDALCEKLSLQPPPYVEDMPEELEIDIE